MLARPGIRTGQWRLIMELLTAFGLGLLLGGAIVFLLNHRQKKEMERTFSSLSLDALRRNSEDFIRLANESLARQAQSGIGELEGKRKLID
jgi:hypothetical protein